MSTFSQLGVSDALIKGLAENNIFDPTEIQKKSIPFLIKEGFDFIGQAQTGTGKTMAFGLPLLQKIDTDNRNVQALILCPTRELGQQIAKQLFRVARYNPGRIFVEAVYGGEPIEIQIKNLSRPTHIIVATPGRLMDLLERKAISLTEIKTIVLDEADEMLSMGFKDSIDTILEQTNGQRQIWLFSATIPESLNKIIHSYMEEDAFKVEVDVKNVVNRDIEHQYVQCIDTKDKLNTLLEFLRTQGKGRGIVFCKTKDGTQSLAKQLIARNYSAEAIHGDLQQRDREKVMRAFKNEKVQILVATDMAARGIDVDNLQYVIHYQLPEQLEYYTHRSGRTGRAGKKGLSISLVTSTEMSRLKTIENQLKITIQKIRRG
ncbi:MAG: box helicase domain protein [Bacteroidetes bacterium]|nr:box helicase domain protein [Bacteroidota bacterium]